MQMFDWFERIVLRIKNRRTRRRVLTNLVLFCFSVGTISVILIYGSAFIKSRAEVDAKSLVPPPIRFEYHAFTGPSTIYAVSKKGMAYSEAKGLEMGARWLKNEVLIAAESLVDQLGIKPEIRDALPNSMFRASVTDKAGKTVHEETHYSYDSSPLSVKDRLTSLLKRDPAKKFFGLPTTIRHLEPAEDMRTALRMVETSQGLRILIDQKELSNIPTKPFEFSSYTVTGFAPESMLSGKINDKWSELLVRKNPGYFDLVKYHSFFFHSSAIASIETRQIRLLALSIENIGDQPIFAPELLVKRLAGTLDGQLRTEKEQVGGLRQAKAESVLPPLDALKPGERLYIPLSLFMEFSKERQTSFPDWRSYQNDAADFEILSSVSPSGQPIVDTLTIDVSDLKKRTPTPQSKNERYYFGPTVEVQSLIVSRPSRSEIPVRRFDPLNVLLQDGDEKGSCPVLFAGVGSKASRIRPVLVNAVTLSGNAIDRVTVLPGVDDFELRELEPERSFISDIRMVVELVDGRKLIYRTDAPIKDLTERHSVLDQGQAISFRFTTQHDRRSEKTRWVEIEGYYVPYVLMQSRPTSGRPMATQSVNTDSAR